MNIPDNSSVRIIPWIGPKIEQKLANIGIRQISDFQNKSPEQIYDQLCQHYGHKLDQCVLYVLRCAVYFINNKKHDPEMLFWWHWKNIK